MKFVYDQKAILTLPQAEGPCWQLANGLSSSPARPSPVKGRRRTAGGV